MSGFTDNQIAALAAPLSRSAVKSRQQAGRAVSYIAGWHVIAEANRIFGFDGWDRETVECRCVSEKPCVIGAGGQYEKPGFRVAYVGKVRVTVRAGEQVIVREGTGYGSGIDADIGEAHESAAKECETDALKRSLMTFGNPFGLALYDKTQSEVEPAQRGRAAPAGGHNPAARSSAAGNGTTPPAATARPLPQGARRLRIKGLIADLQADILTAKNSLALDALWGGETVKLALAEIESAGPAGKEAAFKLRSKFMAMGDKLKDAEARA